MRRPGPGRPAKPIEAKILDGTYRPDRDGPITSADLPEPPPPRPEKLTGDAAAVWDELAPLLAGVIKRRDVPVLVDVCRWLARMERVAAVLDEMSPKDKDFNRVLIAAGICSTNFERFARQFGMTPADRAKLRADHVGPPRPKVATRPRTKLDAAGPPKKE